MTSRVLPLVHAIIPRARYAASLPSRSFLSFSPPKAYSTGRFGAAHMFSQLPLLSQLTSPSPSLLPSSLTQSSLPRSIPSILQFRTQLTNMMRQTYFRDGQSGPGTPLGGGRGNGVFARIRGRIDGIPHTAIFYGIIAANALVFVMWHFATENFRQQQDPVWLRWMYQNFTVSLGNIANGRFWTLITGCFSHSEGTHALMNGLTFWFMAPPVIALLGNSTFLALYLGGGLTCSLASLCWSVVSTGRLNNNSRGASGAINAILAFYACAFPKTTFLLFFVVPVPAWACVGGLAGYDIYNALFQRGSTTDSAGHIGGLLGGILVFLRLRSRGMLF